MATYKKRGAIKSVSSSKENEIAIESTTAEVFDALDSSASKTEEMGSEIPKCHSNHLSVLLQLVF